MWHMFKEIGTYGDVGYGVMGWTHPPPDESKLVGCAKLQAMQACASTAIELSCVLFALAMLLDDHHEPWWLLPSLEKVMTVTAPKWVAHIDSLS